MSLCFVVLMIWRAPSSTRTATLIPYPNLFRSWRLGRGEPPDPARRAAPVAGIRLEWWLYILSILSIGVVWWLVQNQAVVGTLLGISGAILVIYVLATAVDRKSVV